MGDIMSFPKTAEEFINDYKFKDRFEVYTNGSDLIPVFRVKQMLEHYFPNGAIVPPCKVGDELYYPWIYNDVSSVAILEVEKIVMLTQGNPLVCVCDPESDMPMPLSFTEDDFGKIVFRRYEDAKKKLQKGGEG